MLVSQHGGWMPTWAMNPAGNPSDAVWQQDITGLTAQEFSPSLAPLQPFADRMIAPDGSLVYLPEDFDGFLGYKRLVNGRIDPYL